jgi:hypothetical protein
MGPGYLTEVIPVFKVDLEKVKALLGTAEFEFLQFLPGPVKFLPELSQISLP